ncbi:hypothetical protein C0J52_01193 [Blattella germanica]|nr:hypothetical protein C0J52_01193 [Blattella germanica]
MSLDIITFEKSFEERYDEYMSILGSRSFLPGSEVKNEWICYIQPMIPIGGWQAVWKISRLKCEEFDINFPTVVLVMDDISLPEVHMVPLIYLYPTKQQESDLLAITEIASCLDQFRLFYNNLWQPWDCEDENVDWVSTHLHARLRMFYDMQLGILPHGTGLHIRSLLQEAREIQYRMEELEDENSSNPDEEQKNKDNLLALIELQIRREQIKSEIEILENPDVRHLVVKKKTLDYEKKRKIRDFSTEFCFVWLGGTIDELIENLNKIKSHFHYSILIKTSPLLQEALDQAIPGDTIILCPGIHRVHSLSGQDTIGTLQGYMEPSASTIVSRENRSIFLDLNGGITFENLTIDAEIVKIAMACRGGLTTLKNCRILGKSSSQTGILVERGIFEAENCEFICFGIGIILQSGAEVSLINCKISCCNTGLKISEGAMLDLQKSNISECLEHGIQFETIEAVDDAVTRFDKIKLKETVLEKNKKGDVLVVQRLVHDSLYELEDPSSNYDVVQM